MTFKPKLWFPIAAVATALNLASVYVFAAEPMHATGHAVAALLFGIWAERLRQRLGTGASEVAGVQEDMDRQADALESAESTLALQSRQIAELQERLDFAERVMIQNRNKQMEPPKQP